MQGDYFAFYLPTFEGAAETHAADKFWEAQRLTKFFTVGVVGLEAMDQQRATDKKGIRSGLTKHLRGTGKSIPPLVRVGRGSAGTMVAFAELNDRVRTALRVMTEREEQLLSISGTT
jgi:hypothetical protein